MPADRPAKRPASLRAQVLDLLLELQADMGISYLFVSHDISVIRYMCDRVAVMHQGSIVEIDTADAVFNDPKHPCTRSLISAVPVPDPRRRGIANRTRYGVAAVTEDAAKAGGGK
jgi:peptide/nickel transport system ATP-binding protein